MIVKLEADPGRCKLKFVDFSICCHCFQFPDYSCLRRRDECHHFGAKDHIRADLPPDPQEVLWQDLAVSPERQSLLELCGYFLIFLIFWGFMPVVVFIQSVANLSTLEKDVGCLWLQHVGQHVAANAQCPVS